MSETLIYTIVATTIISLGAFAGILTLSLKEKILSNILLTMVAFSAGSMLGGAFIHLMPEGIENSKNSEQFFLITLLAIIVYFLIEKVLHWRHCHRGGGQCQTHQSIGYMNLIGDSVHNFIDGLIIAAAFIVSIPLGITTAIAIALHEIPQEIGDFGVLLYSGFKKKKALLLNFLVALTTIIGGIVGYILSSKNENTIQFVIPIAAGGFIYIAVSDLLPEVKKTQIGRFLLNFIFLFLGIVFMYLSKLFVG